MKKHTEDFKREAVRIALSSGLSRRRVASDLGVGLSTPGKWVCECRPADIAGAPLADLARENERLRLENRVLKEERDILKKYGPPRRQGVNSSWHDGSASTYPVSRLKPWPRWISAQSGPHKSAGAEHHI